MKITRLEKRIGPFHLQVDNLYIETGKIHAIVGPNGCGKTVFLKVLAGVLPIDMGSIDYEGMDRRDITMMSQRPYLMQTTVYNNLTYPLKLRGIKPNEKDMDRMLERVGLLPLKHQYARALSSGERQKLSFLRAVVFHPKIVMVDETLSNLDEESEAMFKQMILEIQEKEPITWVIVDHQMEHISGLCDCIHYMKKGRFVEK